MFYDQKRSINDNDDKYDHVAETTTINSTQIYTDIFYSCTLANQCEEKFLVETLVRLLKKDYVQMQNALMDMLISKESNSLTCNQGSHEQLVQCNGTCINERSQALDFDSKEVIFTSDTPSCQSKKQTPYVIITTTKIPYTTRTMLTREVWFGCSKDYCNNKETMARIDDIINKTYVPFYQQ